MTPKWWGDRRGRTAGWGSGVDLGKLNASEVQSKDVRTGDPVRGLSLGATAGTLAGAWGAMVADWGTGATAVAIASTAIIPYRMIYHDQTSHIIVSKWDG